MSKFTKKLPNLLSRSRRRCFHALLVAVSRSKEVEKPGAEKPAEKSTEKAEEAKEAVEKPQESVSGRLLGSAMKSLLKQFDSTAAGLRSKGL